STTGCGWTFVPWFTVPDIRYTFYSLVLVQKMALSQKRLRQSDLAFIQIRYDDSQVVSNHAPTDPAFETSMTMIKTAPQMPRAPQLANAAFNPGPETTRGTKPELSLIAPALSRRVARLGQAYTLDAQLAGLA